MAVTASNQQLHLSVVTVLTITHKTSASKLTKQSQHSQEHHDPLLKPFVPCDLDLLPQK